jgi:hypothetical protein
MMRIKAMIKSQYYASLMMLRQAIVECPDSLWSDPEYKNQFWNIAYHVLFYTHLYLHPSEADFVPWESHRDELVSMRESERDVPSGDPYTKEEILAFHELCLEQMTGFVDSVDLDAESGFYWLPFDKLELQIYNIRHLQHHTGELCERLGESEAIEVGWVGMKEV